MIRENPAVLVDDPKREIRTFRLILGASMGSKRGQGRGSFVTSVLDLLDGFYEDVIQSIKPWSAAPPRLRPKTPEPPEPTVPAALASTSLSSQDGAEPAVIRPKPTDVVDDHHPDPGAVAGQQDPESAILAAEAAVAAGAIADEPTPLEDRQALDRPHA